MFKVVWDRADKIELSKDIDAVGLLEKKRGAGMVGFIDAAKDKNKYKKTKETAQWVRENSKDLVVLGIGGSSLGGKTIISSLTNRFANKAPRVTFADNIDPDYFAELMESLDLKSTVFNVISKSGSTAETMAQFLYIYEKLLKKLGQKEAVSRIVLTTDPSKGALRPLERSMGFKTLEVPQNIGGRFSVLTDVGLFPAAVAGVDIDAMLEGADEVAKTGMINDVSKNPVLKYSLLKHAFYNRGCKSSVMMPYSTKLADLSAWYVQLWAESLGKKGLGQTPLPATGATDQHSQLQLFMEGPKDKFITFIGVEKTAHDVNIPKFDSEVEAFSYLSGHSMNELIRAEMISTEKALHENGVPSVRIELPRLDAYNLGSLFMFFEIAVALTGELTGVDAFDQPGVELSKKYTYQMMGRRGC